MQNLARSRHFVFIKWRIRCKVRQGFGWQAMHH
jgi:hypothetical protein